MYCLSFRDRLWGNRPGSLIWMESGRGLYSSRAQPHTGASGDADTKLDQVLGESGSSCAALGGGAPSSEANPEVPPRTADTNNQTFYSNFIRNDHVAERGPRNTNGGPHQSQPKG